jgi:hypothetical protein
MLECCQSRGSNYWPSLVSFFLNLLWPIIFIVDLMQVLSPNFLRCKVQDLSCIWAEINHSAWLDPASALETIIIYGLGVWACYIGLARRESESPQPAERQLIILVSASWPNSAPVAFGENLGVAKSAYPSIQWSIANRVAMLTPCRPHTLLYVALALSPQVSRPSLSDLRISGACRLQPPGGWAVASSACPTRCMGSMEAMHASPLPVEPRWRTFMPASTSSLVSTATAARRV